LADITSTKSIDNIIYGVRLAVHLLKEKQYDAVLDRGYERVTFSTLDVNPEWEREILAYYDELEQSMEKELFTPLEIVRRVT
jgi:hypothetical protein